jgi:hypothetical protein
MLELGHSHRVAVALLWLWSAVIAFGVVLIGITDAWWRGWCSPSAWPSPPPSPSATGTGAWDMR